MGLGLATTMPHRDSQLAVFQGKVVLQYDVLEAEVGMEGEVVLEVG